MIILYRQPWHARTEAYPVREHRLVLREREALPSVSKPEQECGDRSLDLYEEISSSIPKEPKPTKAERVRVADQHRRYESIARAYPKGEIQGYARYLEAAKDACIAQRGALTNEVMGNLILGSLEKGKMSPSEKAWHDSLSTSQTLNDAMDRYFLVGGGKTMGDPKEIFIAELSAMGKVTLQDLPIITEKVAKKLQTQANTLPVLPAMQEIPALLRGQMVATLLEAMGESVVQWQRTNKPLAD